MPVVPDIVPISFLFQCEYYIRRSGEGERVQGSKRLCITYNNVETGPRDLTNSRIVFGKLLKYYINKTLIRLKLYREFNYKVLIISTLVHIIIY